MRTKDETKDIFGEVYTLDDVDWCVQTGYPVEDGRMSHTSMICGLWNGNEQAINEMREYMQSHEFKRLESAGRIYHAIMNKLHPQGMCSVTDARYVYEAILRLPCDDDLDYRHEIEQKYSKYIATIRRNRERKTMRMSA